MTSADRIFHLHRKLRFLLTPLSRRVRLDLETDGRHLTFLLVSLYEKGFVVYVPASPIVYRELLSLRKSAPIPFIVGGPPRPCGIALCDTEAAIHRGTEPRQLRLDYRYFDQTLNFPRMPYFMHPNAYARGYHLLSQPRAEAHRPIRIGFFGSRDATFYTKHFHFPILNREQILETFLTRFQEKIWRVDAPVEEWTQHDIALSIDGKGGDRDQKNFLPQGDYFQALRKCDFLLVPPGWCMPLSHALIEGMAAGCIPILNSADSLVPRLDNGANCLTFRAAHELEAAVGTALSMPAETIDRMRRKVADYYLEYLSPGKWFDRLPSDRQGSLAVLVNAEEASLGIKRINLD